MGNYSTLQALLMELRGETQPEAPFNGSEWSRQLRVIRRIEQAFPGDTGVILHLYREAQEGKLKGFGDRLCGNIQKHANSCLEVISPDQYMQRKREAWRDRLATWVLPFVGINALNLQTSDSEQRALPYTLFAISVLAFAVMWMRGSKSAEVLRQSQGAAIRYFCKQLPGVPKQTQGMDRLGSQSKTNMTPRALRRSGSVLSEVSKNPPICAAPSLSLVTQSGRR